MFAINTKTGELLSEFPFTEVSARADYCVLNGNLDTLCIDQVSHADAVLYNYMR